MQYNQVKLIPSKEHSEMFGQYREPSFDDVEDPASYYEQDHTA